MRHHGNAKARRRWSSPLLISLAGQNRTQGNDRTDAGFVPSVWQPGAVKHQRRRSTTSGNNMAAALGKAVSGATRSRCRFLTFFSGLLTSACYSVACPLYVTILYVLCVW